MSVRAYRIKKIDHAGESFNLWHDEELVHFLEKEGFYESLNLDASGISDVSVETLEEAIKTVPMEEETKNNLKRDIGIAKEKGESWITYYCY